MGNGDSLYLTVVVNTFAKIQNLHFTQVQFRMHNEVHLEKNEDYVSHQSLAVQEGGAAATRNCPVGEVHDVLHLP